MISTKQNILKQSLRLLHTTLQTSTHAKHNLQPVKLAYASYEAATSPMPEEPPPLIIKHGLFGSKANWNSLCKVYHKKTVPQRKVIAIDARNHGDSPHTDVHTYDHLVEDIRDLYQQLGIQKASLMGHSMGGRAVMLFALKYPQLVEKLIVADISPVTTSPNLQTMPALFAAMQNINLPKDVPLSSARMDVDQQLSKVITDKGLRSFLLTNLVQKSDGSYAWRINISALADNFSTISTFPPIAGLKFEGPVLFVGGTLSDFLPKSDHSEILKLFPQAQFEYIANAGHWLHSEKPTEFLEVTTQFLNKLVTNT